MGDWRARVLADHPRLPELPVTVPDERGAGDRANPTARLFTHRLCGTPRMATMLEPERRRCSEPLRILVLRELIAQAAVRRVEASRGDHGVSSQIIGQRLFTTWANQIEGDFSPDHFFNSVESVRRQLMERPALPTGT